MSTQERSHDQLATSFTLGETQPQATFTTSYAEIHPVTFNWNLVFKSCDIWLSALTHVSIFSEDAEVTKCPLFTSSQLSKICVTQPSISH